MTAKEQKEAAKNFAAKWAGKGYEKGECHNFPWPRSVGEASDESELKEKIAQTAQGILDARAKYPDCALADLYDDTFMPPELRKAHGVNDAAVMEAYGFPKTLTEPEIVARLFELYAELTGKFN